MGAASHLGPELFNAMAGVNIVHVLYKGSGATIIDLLGGQVQISFTSAGSVAQHVRTGRLSGLAITSAQPTQLVPGLPTVAASGLPGYEAVSVTALLAAPKTPLMLADRLNAETRKVLKRADIREKFFNAGVEISAGTPDQLSAAIKSEMARLGKVIRDAGIRAVLGQVIARVCRLRV